MKILNIAPSFILLALFASCGQENKSKKTAELPVDSLEFAMTAKQQEQANKQEARKLQEATDSTKLSKILADALSIADQNISKDTFSRQYEVKPDNEYTVKVEISFDYYFSKLQPHLIIRRIWPFAVNIDIYSKNENKFEKVLSHEQWTMEYLSDTIRDVNGDGRKDFVVNWYGANGCCLKAFSNIYLLRNDQKTFSDDFEFINPTFSPKEKLIRGVCYGHPGETEMYKYKWRGESIDTIEYLYFEKNEKGEKTGKFVTSKHGTDGDGSEPIIKRLNSVPQEYRNIEGYFWFMGDLN